MTVLLVVLRPVDADVDNEFSPLSVAVDSDATVLLVVLRPVEADVDSEVIELVADDRPVEADVL
ncbi:hypothetical protein, partial [Burkholderia contaminans]|uniref:hypothetical protein n=1 Tax=Burkholderia contaminans TaxID=488447 RepID=UPI003BFA0183